jgi:pyrroline-5-carboxylate reductase
MLKEKIIGIIGAGKMGSALISGLLNKGLNPENVIISDKFSVQEAKRKFGVEIMDNPELAKKADIIILAVQPADIFECLQAIYPFIDNSKLIISIAAGIKVEVMRSVLKKGRFIRVMPNVAALVKEAVSAIYCGPRTTKEDEEVATAILSLVGEVVIIHNEHYMDAVTGLSGSGPAYIFEVIEALADGGVKVGLKRADALKLAAQTVKGAAELVLKTQKHPAELKDMVASPGGTTIYGLAELERKSTRGAFIDAVVAATRRSEELGS